jgi:hypothetical protein
MAIAELNVNTAARATRGIDENLRMMIAPSVEARGTWVPPRESHSDSGQLASDC